MCTNSQRQIFFSIPADGTTGHGNVEDKLFLVMFLDQNGQDRQIHVCSKFLAVREPKSVDAKGLFNCFKSALGHVGITEDMWMKKLVGFGCDGAS